MRFALLIFSLLGSLQVTPQNVTIKFTGAAQGTTYHITYLAGNGLNYKKEIDSILADLDTSLSTYVPVSIISRMNSNDSDIQADHYFTEVFKKSIEVSRRTGGLFDITVAPLVNAYGFGFTQRAMVNNTMIDSLLNFVGYQKVKLKGGKLLKSRPEVMLDLNAIAQGYSVDVLARFLETRNIKNYLVELGGEVLAKGSNEHNESWKVGIEQPSESVIDVLHLQAVVSLNNRALATSGNYKKFYIENGKRYPHIIDPRTGYPAQHNLLSATVLAPDCMTADAYATAFMVMGTEGTKKFLKKNRDLKLEVYLIFYEENQIKTFASPGMKEWIKEIQ
jgi:thiamine biosynthesis lipoprotein